jgi:acetyltransferase-like isoleucine patch superfamily enzyme
MMPGSVSGPQRTGIPGSPRRTGIAATIGFWARNRMVTPKYARLVARMLWRRYLTPTGRRIDLDGMLFLGSGVKIQVGRRARVRFGRWTWIGDGTKIRCHEGEVRIGDKTVLGQECTISAYQRVWIGEQCIVADRVMMIDFDHCVTEVERPIRAQGIYKRDVRVGNNVWVGYGAQILRGVTVGDNAIIGASAVVTRDIPANAVVAGSPARIVRMREAPQTLRWREPVEPQGGLQPDAHEAERM